MPELPEVETTRRGIEPYIAGRMVTSVEVRNPRFRWPVSPTLPGCLEGRRITSVERRGKYLLFRTDSATTMIVHLGMSGSLSVFSTGSSNSSPGVHDHIDWSMSGGICLRMRDPRRFGAVLLTDAPPLDHPLLRGLGPEPFDSLFSGEYLYRIARSRKVTVKQFIMDGRIVVGVGNIYASEALFRSGIRPGVSCRRISRPRYLKLKGAVVQVLGQAIEQGGTTLRDFVREDGRPGYFKQQLNVYGREGLPCLKCDSPIRLSRIGQRSSFFCPDCQH
ncbi:MAG: bifunctional DNA-formamidopyrimidine glycosylase/DNA-(apurinic or apyrimidinic site) lyase [Gammaproteobacteria bacterium]|nr:bifunctional DNA-formamidopyrimidine glycosylase/DNA-(apurinic or apyrimidinic site) lyase [Gammaproteobacteria bacterium]